MISLNKFNKKSVKKPIYLLIFLLFIFFIFSSYIASYNFDDSVQVSNLNISDEFKNMSTAINDDEYVIQKKEESTDYYTISIYYPLTKYDTLNQAVSSILNSYIDQLKGSIDDNSKKQIEQTKAKYFLDIKFNMYKYLHYVSYVFYISNYTGGAHPNAYFSTVTFDKNKLKLVTIDDLLKQNKALLVELSQYTYNDLVNNATIKDIGALDMVKDGTEATKENFRNFALTSDGMMIFFEKYQVAPYVAGEFAVSVPYDKINLNLK